MKATVTGMRELRFEGARPELDLPGHVRAGSGIRRLGERLVIVQDDVNALAVLPFPRAGAAARGLEGFEPAVAVALPRGADGRRVFGKRLGNKALKLDLEACLRLPDGRLVALGSGSTSRRETLVVIDETLDVSLIDGADLYAAFRANAAFAGSELNIEGAAVAGDDVVVFQRGNGATRHGLEPVNATGLLDVASFVAWLEGGPVPLLERVRQHDLGAVDGVRFGFTDAAALPDGRVAFLAGAEDSPDTFQDGVVMGCRFGVLDGDSVALVDICGADGAPSALKLEGLEWVGAREDGSWEFVVVADMDDPDVAAVAATLLVSNP